MTAESPKGERRAEGHGNFISQVSTGAGEGQRMEKSKLSTKLNP